MPTRHRSAWQRSLPEGRGARVAVSLAIPVALAAVVGVIVAVSSGGGVSNLRQSALANCASPSAGTTASPAPCPSDPAATGAQAAKVNPEAGTPDVALKNPVDAAGNAINLNQTAAEAANTLNCTIMVPANPLSAQGLATPWQLGDGCSEANPNEAAFVEATILGTNGQVSVYNPLVITQGSTPAATPQAPTLPQGAKVIIDTGFNGNSLVYEGTGATQANCIDAFGNSIISQTAACGAAAFYQDANSQIARGTLKVPPLGTGTDGKPCESTRSFSLIDQDQSDNVDSAYLLNGNGQTAQDSAANVNALAGATVLANGSDDGLLDAFVDPALGCKPFAATDTTAANGTSGSQALNELSARQNQRGTIALLPVNDPQLLVAGQFSIGKTNTYRSLTDQPQINGGGFGQGGNGRGGFGGGQGGFGQGGNGRGGFGGGQGGFGRGGSGGHGFAVNLASRHGNNGFGQGGNGFNGNRNQNNGNRNQNNANQNNANNLLPQENQMAATYCQNMVNIAPAKLQLDMAKEVNFTSPVPAVGNNLATFLGNRLSMSFTNLNCQNFGLKNPVTVTLDGNGVATAVTYNTTQQKATVPNTATPAGKGKGGYNTRVPRGRFGHKENAAGM